MTLSELREKYHQRICREVVRLKGSSEARYPNFADVGSKSSKEIALSIVDRLGCVPSLDKLSGQHARSLFRSITRDFLERSFGLLHPLRPGEWRYSIQNSTAEFDQYAHLLDLERIIEGRSELASALGMGFIIKPDIVIGRCPISDEEINQEGKILSSEDPVAKLTPLREANSETSRLILHASISCKWTLRSDRAQNARAEALNLVRNRKGPLPHVVAVTAEPLPSRIAALALGTGDLDCVYHFALPELQEALLEADNEGQMEILNTLIGGRRLRDISDLPFDLAT